MHRLRHYAFYYSRQLTFLLLILSIAVAAGAAGVSVVGVQSRIGAATWTGAAGVASDASGNIYLALNNPASVVIVNPTTGTGIVYLASAHAVGGQTLSSLRDLLIDSSNNLYISDIGNNRIIKLSLTTGNVVATYTGTANSMALDRSGNLWYGDINGNVSRILAGASAGSIVLTGAGAVWGMAFDSGNNLFVADNTGNAIRRYASPGTGAITVPITVSGPRGLYFDANDNLYVAVKSTNQVLKYTAASSYSAGYPVAFDMPDVTFVAANPSGDLFVTDYGNASFYQISQKGYGWFYPVLVSQTSQTPVIAILQVASGTTIGSFAPVLQGGGGYDFGAASVISNACPTGYYSTTTNCRWNASFSPTIPGNKLGGMQVLDSGGSSLLASILLSGIGHGPQVTITSGVITTQAGTGAACTTSPCGDGLVASSAQLTLPTDLAFDGAGNLYIADAANNRVRKVLGTSQVISTVAGTGVACSSLPCGDGGAAANAQLNAPHGLAVDGVGNLYIAEAQGHRVRKVDPILHWITTVAGTGVACSSSSAQCGDSGQAASAQLNTPTGVAVDGAGNLFIADSLDHRIRRVDAVTKVITTVAGTGNQCGNSMSSCGDGGLSTSAQLNQPNNMTVDAAGNLYIADSLDNRIRKVDASTHDISTLVGTGSPCTGAGPCGDGGAALSAMLNNPSFVDVDPAGNLYIADSASMRVRKVDAFTQTIYTVAGTGASCGSTITCNEGKAATAAALDSLYSLRIDRYGDLYLALGDSNVVRHVTAAGAPLAYPATVQNTPSATQSVLLSNIGTDSLSFNVVTDNSAFVLNSSGSNACSGTLAAGASCTQSLYFEPSYINNSITGNLHFYDSAPNSPQSVALSGRGVATQTSQTIAFPNPGTQIYGVSPITLTATASSALPVSYLVVSGPASVNGSVLTITGVGAVTIQATQAGNDTYAPATSVTVNFSVNPHSLTITASGYAKPYGQTYVTGAGSLAFTSLGLVNGDLIDSVTITANGGTASADPLGTYALSASSPVGIRFNAANYNITYNTGTLTVIPGTLTITASNVSKVYGQTASFGTMTTGFTATGLANGQQVSTVFITASGGTAANSPVNNYTLTPSNAAGTFTAGNYNVVYVAATLQVVGYPLTITANDDNKQYGTARSYGAGSTAYTTSGLLNNDTIGTVTITASGGTAANAAATTYSLMPSAATGGSFNPSNYSITYAPGKLTVTPAPLTITAASGTTRVYGQTGSYGAGSSAFTSSGLLNGDTIGTVTLTPSGGSGANLPVGNYVLTPSAATGGSFTASNYSITYVAGTLAVTQAPLTITANADIKPYGQARTYGPVSVGYTVVGLVAGESIASVTLSASGGAAANSPLGSYTLTPSAATGGTFSASNYAIIYVSGTLQVVQGTLVIRATDDTKPYGQVKTYGVMTAGFTISGNAAGETVGNVTITANGGTNSNSPAGSYSLTPGAASGGTFTPGNYAISYVAGTLTVTQAPLTITAGNDSKVYGELRTYGPNQTTFNSSGLLLGETIGSITIAANAGAAINGPVGTYSLTPSAATGGSFLASNYSINYVAGTLTVNPAPLTIAAVSGSKTYGIVRNYGTTSTGFTSTGLVAGDVISSVTISTNGGGAGNAPVGSYTLMVSLPTGTSFNANNYTITYNAGNLAVVPAALSISALNDTKVLWTNPNLWRNGHWL